MTGKQVLAFEADPIYANLLKEQVESRGARFEAVSDGIEGLDRVAELHPDLIYLCVELPKVSGFSICNKLRSNPKLSPIPIILSSAEAGEETFAKHRKLKKSADEYIHKPFDGAQVGQVLGRFLGDGEVDAEPENEESSEAEAFAADDDEFEIEDVEMVEAGEDEVSVQMGVDVMEIENAGADEEVDNEIDAFTDEAFAALELGDEGKTPKPTETKVTTPAPSPVPVAVQEASGVSDEETATLRRRVEELEDALEQALTTKSEQSQDAGGLSDRNDALIDKISQLERELADAKASGGGEGVSSREFLELRESLNKKDRELLDLRDAVNKREKQLLESREKVNELARQKADLEESNIAQARRAHEQEDTIRALTADKDLLARKSDDLQGRVERTQGKLLATEKELETTLEEKREEAQRLASEKEDALAELTASKDDEIAGVTTDKDQQRAEALRNLEAELDQKREEALEELQAEADRVREEALTQQRLRHEEELASEKSKLETEKDEALAESELERAEQLQSQKQDYEGRLAEMLQSHQETVASLEEAKQSVETELAGTREELSGVQSRLSGTQDELGEATKELEQVWEQLGTTQGELKSTSMQLESTEDDLKEERTRAEGLTEELEQTRDRLSSLESDFEELSDVMARNGEIVVKAREALNIITTQLLAEIDLGGVVQEEEADEDEMFEEVIEDIDE